MTQDHPALAVLDQLDTSNMAASAHLFAEDAIFPYCDPSSEVITNDVVVVWRVVEGRIVEVWDIVLGQPTEVRNATQ